MLKPSIFSFFSGAGFLDLGFEMSGFEVVYVNEYHPPFLNGYQHSRSVMGIEPPIFGHESTPIQDLSVLSVMGQMATLRGSGQPIGFVGGPPCPDFSVGGKNRGAEGEKGRLSRAYVDLICQARPDFFLFENVKGLVRTKKHRLFYDQLKVDLKAAGYRLHERLINAIEYGAAQDRDRIILLGFLDPALPEKFLWRKRLYPNRMAFQFEWPETEVFAEGSVRECPDHLPRGLTVQHWFEKNDVLNHPNAAHCFKPRAGLPRFKSILEGDDSKKSYKRLHRWRYSPTAAYGNNEVHLHPYQPRRLNVAETLAIQSLPKEFELPANMTLSNMFKTVGNGVPYVAAVGLAESIRAHLQG